MAPKHVPQRENTVSWYTAVLCAEAIVGIWYKGAEQKEQRWMHVPPRVRNCNASLCAEGEVAPTQTHRAHLST